MVCKTGNRSMDVIYILEEMGYTNLVNLVESIHACKGNVIP